MSINIVIPPDSVLPPTPQAMACTQPDGLSAALRYDFTLPYGELRFTRLPIP